MSRKYKFADNHKLYFVSFAFTNWIDLFIRNEYREEILTSIKYCQTPFLAGVLTGHSRINIIIRDYRRRTDL